MTPAQSHAPGYRPKGPSRYALERTRRGHLSIAIEKCRLIATEKCRSVGAIEAVVVGTVRPSARRRVV